jgi:hypothetical protein
MKFGAHILFKEKVYVVTDFDGALVEVGPLFADDGETQWVGATELERVSCPVCLNSDGRFEVL